MALCHSCKDTLKENRSKTIHSTCRSFPAAVDEGCYICRGLFSQIPGEWRQEIRRQFETSKPLPGKRRKLDDSQTRLTWYDRRIISSSTGSIRLDLQVIRLHVDASLHGIEMPTTPCQHLYPVASEPLSWNFTSPSTRSEETFTKIEAWLGRCGKRHERCAHRRDEADLGWHPTRLIEIASESEVSENADSLRCRVVEPLSEDVPQNLRYIESPLAAGPARIPEVDAGQAAAVEDQSSNDDVAPDLSRCFLCCPKARNTLRLD